MAYDPYQDPPLPTNPTQEDLENFQTPIAELPVEMPGDMPVPEKPSKGMSFNFNGLIQQLEQNGFDSLSEAQKHLLWNIKQGNNYSPHEMALFVQDFNKQQRQQSTPKAQAELQRVQAQTELTNQNLKKTKTEERAATTQKLEDAQKTYQSASNMVWLLDNLRGGARDKIAAGNEKWRSRVGAIDGRWPSILSSEETLGWNADYNSLKGMLNLTEAKENRGQGSLTEGERALMAQAASLGLEQARDEGGFNSAFERMYDLALTTQERERKKLLGEPSATQATPQSVPVGQPQAAPAPAPLPQFQSREEIMQAVNSGKISREQGVQALRTQFGNQFR